MNSSTHRNVFLPPPLKTYSEAVLFSLFTKQDIAKSNSRTATLNKITVQIQTYTFEYISNQQICKTTKASAAHHTTDAFVINKEQPLINHQSIVFRSTNLPRSRAISLLAKILIATPNAI